ncbi:hypothetical protein KC19_9G081900 [Ceratodon purpureus]|uniref:RING-type domain-containing protein n=2 Tax=Ceratodon purpureus TaxID=3225 RepID=A0A8T0GPX6_CERPU|nr:hypothetical protein KC19_9G081900 [Ceratodon purpureus]
MTDTNMDRSGSEEFYQEGRVTKEAPSSRALSGGRKILEVGDDGSGRCGICSAYITVCGLLDCCSHEYCFDCIENWSSVSNQCPLCKLQFRFISVEDVHDEDVVEINSLFPGKQEREETSWDNETELPFSFPTFFIDEDAVACLEGNKCLVRAEVPLSDEDAADTSVACDSCDLWYHAGCVGFDPSISWGSWLCPRCSGKAAANKSHQPTPSFPPILPITTVVSSSTSGRVPVVELASTARVLSEYDPSISISLVGEGESALVLSTSRAVESSVISLSKAEFRQAPIFTGGNCPDSRGQTSIKAEEFAYPPLEDKASRIQVPVPSAPEKLDIRGQKPVDAPSVPFVLKPVSNNSTRGDFDLVKRKPKGAASSLTSSVALAKVEQRDLAVVLLQGSQLLLSEEARSDQESETKLEPEFAESAGFQEQPITEKRKQTTKQDRDIVRAEDLPEPPRKIARSVMKKKETVLGSLIKSSLEKPAVRFPKVDSKVSVTKETSPAVKKQIDDNIPYTENVPLKNLVHMVEDEPTVDTGVVKDKHMRGIRSNSAGGVRTRVVMHRDTDGRAAQIVEDIRQEMRSASGYGATDDHGKVAVSDDRFFAAYKAAMVRTNEKSQGVKSQGLKRRRNSWLEKMLDKAPRGKAGGVRESLTKKLYAGGMPRKTWDRDWDISFWKEQSARAKKANQEASDVVEGRASVRAGEFSRDGIVVKEEAVLENFMNVDAVNYSISSRLYVADTSLFPRDNDIKPLYLLSDVKEEGKSKCLGGEKATSDPKSVLKSQRSMGSKGTKAILQVRAEDASTIGSTIPSRDTSEKTNKGTVQGSGLPATNKHVDTPSIVKASSAPDLDEKKDKRQWARELLARKSGDAMASSSTKGHGGIKKYSSLLGQVPEGLRPTLSPDRRTRVPTAVRQSQLNRILEHYLRKANLTSLQGGHKLKSVISSAVAKELEIYDSSNSKGVYINLCVRALALQDEVMLQVTIPHPAEPDGAAAVTEALLATGLISDSPPGSPCEIHNTSTDIRKNEAAEDLPIVQEVSKAGDVEDVLDMSKPATSDVYQDMDLDLEVKSCDGSIAGVHHPTVSSAHPAFPKNKMKVVLPSSIIISSSQVLKSKEQTPEESSTRRENELGAIESKSNAKAGLALVDHQSRSAISTQSIPNQEDKNVDEQVKSTAKFSKGRKAKETSTLAKAGKECSGVPGEGEAGGPNSKKAGSESTFASASVRSSGGSDGDDWMNTGKFPDLESRIDKIRKDVLKMSSSFLSQSNEELVFGCSLHEATSVGEVRLEGGRAAKSSSDAGIPDRKGYKSNPGGKVPEASWSVQKQVEAYVKEHLKPLYKSGVIKSYQFRFAISKTASKVMQHHEDATSADFLIVEGSKVKKLADQYIQSYAQK